MSEEDIELPADFVNSRPKHERCACDAENTREYFDSRPSSILPVQDRASNGRRR